MVGAYCVELWETLEPPAGSAHDYRVLPLMGRDAPITRVPALVPRCTDIKALRGIEFAVPRGRRAVPDRLGRRSTRSGTTTSRARSRCRTRRSRAPRRTPSTIKNYLLDFQRGFFSEDAHEVAPVRYRNAMLNDGDPDRARRQRHRDALGAASASSARTSSSSTR